MTKLGARYKILLKLGWQPTEHHHTLSYNNFQLQWFDNTARLFIPSSLKGCYKQHWYQNCRCIKELNDFFTSINYTS